MFLNLILVGLLHTSVDLKMTQQTPWQGKGLRVQILWNLFDYGILIFIGFIIILFDSFLFNKISLIC